MAGKEYRYARALEVMRRAAYDYDVIVIGAGIAGMVSAGCRKIKSGGQLHQHNLHPQQNSYPVKPFEPRDEPPSPGRSLISGAG